MYNDLLRVDGICHIQESIGDFSYDRIWRLIGNGLS